MSDSKRSDDKSIPQQPGPPGVGTPFAGESSPGNIPIPAKQRSEYDPNATIVDISSGFDPESKPVDPNATILDGQAIVLDADAKIASGTSVPRTPSPRSP